MGAVIELAGVDVDPTATINVSERLVIGTDSKVSAGCVIEGRDIEIGNGLWMLPGAVIGGGSAFEKASVLRAGHYLHMGRDTLINTARAVYIGDEVGLGTGTKLFTHGAYLSELEGFPVSFGEITIGDRVWLPGATVNPGVDIGDDVVVGVGSLVLSDIPSGSLAVGTPAKVIREGAYPTRMTDGELLQWWNGFVDAFPDRHIAERLIFDPKARTISTARSMFFLDLPRKIIGVVDRDSERLRDELRRRGIRFYASPMDGRYWAWNG
jgi:acetyltransferase-like isoleucine patch superfamily enzyme